MQSQFATAGGVVAASIACTRSVSSSASSAAYIRDVTATSIAGIHDVATSGHGL